MGGEIQVSPCNASKNKEMDMDHIEKAVRIAEAQAHVRSMTADEVCDMVRKLSDGFKRMTDDGDSEHVTKPVVDPKRAIKQKSITCLECGRSFKSISRKHLESHGLTPDEYRAKWGYPRRSPLSCRETAKSRSQRMKDMKLWAKTKKLVEPPKLDKPKATSKD